MKIEVLNTIKKNGDGWEFSGRFNYNSQWIPAIGKVSDYKTESQIKKAIIKKLKAKAEAYKAEKSQPQQKTLSEDSIFKAVFP